LFLWINVAFFVVQSLSGLGILTWPLRVHLSDDSFAWLTTRMLAQHRPDVAVASNHAYADMFDALEGVHAKSLVIVMVPAFAISLAALLFDRRAPFTHSLIFSTHFFAFRADMAMRAVRDDRGRVAPDRNRLLADACAPFVGPRRIRGLPRRRFRRDALLALRRNRVRFGCAACRCAIL